ncbi:MAG: hypothetical protein ACRDIE_06820 [Chloroflexota bacterium]
MSTLGATMPGARAATNGAAAVYAPVKADLQHVLIPVALPTTFPMGDMPNGTRVYAGIEEYSLSATTYIVDLGFTKDCAGGGACRLGEATGGWTGDTPGVLVPARGGVPIALHGGAKGTFYPFTCGAGCGDSVILWHAHGIPYTVSLKAGSRSNVLRMANSAIANTRSSS